MMNTMSLFLTTQDVISVEFNKTTHIIRPIFK